MIRLLGLMAVLGLAVAAVLIVVGAAMKTGPSRETLPATADPLPGAIRRVSYFALVILMLGVTTGWLGGV